jgi:hypothetical protein
VKVTFAQRKLFALVRHFSRAVLPLAALLGLLLAPSPAAAVTVPLIFDGPENTFDASLDLSGNLFADGNGIVVDPSFLKARPYKFTAPFNHPASLFGGPVSVKASPDSADFGATIDATPTGHVTDINGLDLELFNGQSADFSFDTLVLTTNSVVPLMSKITFDLSGSLSSLRFSQTGPAIIAGAGSTGGYSIPGTFFGDVSNSLAVILGLLQIPTDDMHLSAPIDFVGTWTTSGPPGNTKVALDGNFSAVLPLSLHTNFNTTITDVLSLTYRSTMDLTVSFLLSGSYHLESTIVIPEPGSIALLVVGLVALVPLTRRRRIAT